jgi:hypothetical protein
MSFRTSYTPSLVLFNSGEVAQMMLCDYGGNTTSAYLRGITPL